MDTLELFSGTKSFSKVAAALGHSTYTIDLNPKFAPDLVKDVLELEVSDLPYAPAIVWASPPCTTFSVASISTHWRGGEVCVYPTNARG